MAFRCMNNSLKVKVISIFAVSAEQTNAIKLHPQTKGKKKSDFMNVFRIELQGDNATNLVASALP